MKVRYIGTDDPTDNTECTAFGRSFTKGEWVEMGDVPPRLLTNWTFQTEAAEQVEPVTGYADMTVKALRALASERGVELGSVTAKADIVAAFEAFDAKPSADAPPVDDSAASPA